MKTSTAPSIIRLSGALAASLALRLSSRLDRLTDYVSNGHCNRRLLTESAMQHAAGFAQAFGLRFQLLGGDSPKRVPVACQGFLDYGTLLARAMLAEDNFANIASGRVRLTVGHGIIGTLSGHIAKRLLTLGIVQKWAKTADTRHSAVTAISGLICAGMAERCATWRMREGIAFSKLALLRDHSASAMMFKNMYTDSLPHDAPGERCHAAREPATAAAGNSHGPANAPVSPQHRLYLATEQTRLEYWRSREALRLNSAVGSTANSAANSLTGSRDRRRSTSAAAAQLR